MKYPVLKTKQQTGKLPAKKLKHGVRKLFKHKYTKYNLNTSQLSKITSLTIFSWKILNHSFEISAIQINGYR